MSEGVSEGVCVCECECVCVCECVRVCESVCKEATVETQRAKAQNKNRMASCFRVQTSGCVTCAYLDLSAMGRINRSNLGGFRVNPSPTNVCFVIIRFHAFSVVECAWSERRSEWE